ncbi:MAG: hypothetical protein A4E49_02509 [Methanosaeta sp. PtaU1.Bin112]|nr:MAG: hypothetical protein A4E49_02509 [Methanosaeta sp. PtaU1.Bin112]
MPGRQLTTSSTVICPHGGRALLSTANRAVFADGSKVLLESDVHPVTGCPFTVGSSYSPCVRIEWQSGTGRVSIDRTATLVETSIGQCLNAAGSVQGVAIVVNTQQRASGQ